MKQVRYYREFTDDFEKSAGQDFKLKDDYKWVRTDPLSKILSVLIYGAAVLFSGIYCKLFLHVKIRGRKNLRGVKDGFFIYGNHTQPIGDVFIPALCALPRRIYTVVSTANYGIPFIGRILPYLGALPVVSSPGGIKELRRAIEYRIERKNPIVIYPEAHVWEYYTGIRPFPDTSFKFPASLECPVFAMTVTYRKSKVFRRPVTEVFIDGPFYARADTIRQKAAELCERVYRTMEQRSKNSNTEYIEYRRFP